MKRWFPPYETPRAQYSNGTACDVLALAVTFAVVVALIEIIAFLVGWL